MNLEHPEDVYYSKESRIIKKVVKPLRPTQQMENSFDSHQDNESYIIFRLKRSAKIDPVDILGNLLSLTESLSLLSN